MQTTEMPSITLSDGEDDEVVIIEEDTDQVEEWNSNVRCMFIQCMCRKTNLEDLIKNYNKTLVEVMKKKIDWRMLRKYTLRHIHFLRERYSEKQDYTDGASEYYNLMQDIVAAYGEMVFRVLAIVPNADFKKSQVTVYKMIVHIMWVSNVDNAYEQRELHLLQTAMKIKVPSVVNKNARKILLFNILFRYPFKVTTQALLTARYVMCEHYRKMLRKASWERVQAMFLARNSITMDELITLPMIQSVVELKFPHHATFTLQANNPVTNIVDKYFAYLRKKDIEVEVPEMFQGMPLPKKKCSPPPLAKRDTASKKTEPNSDMQDWSRKFSTLEQMPDLKYIIASPSTSAGLYEKFNTKRTLVEVRTEPALDVPGCSGSESSVHKRHGSQVSDVKDSSNNRKVRKVNISTRKRKALEVAKNTFTNGVTQSDKCRKLDPLTRKMTSEKKTVRKDVNGNEKDSLIDLPELVFHTKEIPPVPVVLNKVLQSTGVAQTIPVSLEADQVEISKSVQEYQIGNRSEDKIEKPNRICNAELDEQILSNTDALEVSNKSELIDVLKPPGDDLFKNSIVVNVVSITTVANHTVSSADEMEITQERKTVNIEEINDVEPFDKLKTTNQISSSGNKVQNGERVHVVGVGSKTIEDSVIDSTETCSNHIDVLEQDKVDISLSSDTEITTNDESASIQDNLNIDGQPVPTLVNQVCQIEGALETDKIKIIEDFPNSVKVSGGKETAEFKKFDAVAEIDCSAAYENLQLSKKPLSDKTVITADANAIVNRNDNVICQINKERATEQCGLQLVVHKDVETQASDDTYSKEIDSHNSELDKSSTMIKPAVAVCEVGTDPLSIEELEIDRFVNSIDTAQSNSYISEKSVTENNVTVREVLLRVTIDQYSKHSLEILSVTPNSSDKIPVDDLKLNVILKNSSSSNTQVKENSNTNVGPSVNVSKNETLYNEVNKSNVLNNAQCLVNYNKCMTPKTNSGEVLENESNRTLHIEQNKSDGSHEKHNEVFRSNQSNLSGGFYEMAGIAFNSVLDNRNHCTKSLQVMENKNCVENVESASHARWITASKDLFGSVASISQSFNNEKYREELQQKSLGISDFRYTSGEEDMDIDGSRPSSGTIYDNKFDDSILSSSTPKQLYTASVTKLAESIDIQSQKLNPRFAKRKNNTTQPNAKKRRVTPARNKRNRSGAARGKKRMTPEHYSELVAEASTHICVGTPAQTKPYHHLMPTVAATSLKTQDLKISQRRSKGVTKRRKSNSLAEESPNCLQKYTSVLNNSNCVQDIPDHLPETHNREHIFTDPQFPIVVNKYEGSKEDVSEKAANKQHKQARMKSCLSGILSKVDTILGNSPKGKHINIHDEGVSKGTRMDAEILQQCANDRPAQNPIIDATNSSIINNSKLGPTRESQESPFTKENEIPSINNIDRFTGLSDLSNSLPINKLHRNLPLKKRCKDLVVNEMCENVVTNAASPLMINEICDKDMSYPATAMMSIAELPDPPKRLFRTPAEKKEIPLEMFNCPEPGSGVTGEIRDERGLSYQAVEYQPYMPLQSPYHVHPTPNPHNSGAQYLHHNNSGSSYLNFIYRSLVHRILSNQSFL